MNLIDAPHVRPTTLAKHLPLSLTDEVMERPEIDVLMPCAGSAAYFRESLSAALSQKFPARKVYVLDNQSPHDRYRAIAKDLDDGSIVYHRFQVRLPITHNWQRCLQFGSAAVVAFLHDDDVWPANYLSSSWDRLRSGQAFAVLSSKIHFDVPNCPRDPEEGLRLGQLVGQSEAVRSLALLTSCTGHMSALLFKRGPVAFQPTSGIVTDQLFLDQFVYSGGLQLNADVQVKIREHPEAASNSVSQGRWMTELIKRIRENLMEYARLYDPTDDELRRFVQWKGKESLESLIIACFAGPVPLYFREFRARLLSAGLWSSASGQLSWRAGALHRAPAVVKEVACRVAWEMYARRSYQ